MSDARAAPPDYFELLGIDRLASDDQVRKAMLCRTKQLQEQRVEALRAGRETASYDRQTSDVLVAYRALRRGPDRLGYRKRLERGRGETAAPPEGAADLLVRGLLELREGKTRSGCDLLWSASQVEFDSFPVLLAAGRAYLQAAHGDEQARGRAETLLKTAAAANPADPEALYQLALLYGRMRRYATAIGLLREALSRDPLYPEAWRRLRYLEKRAADPAAGAAREAAAAGLGGWLQRLGLRSRAERRVRSGDRRRSATSKRHPERRRRVRRLADLGLPIKTDWDSS